MIKHYQTTNNSCCTENSKKEDILQKLSNDKDLAQPGLIHSFPGQSEQSGEKDHERETKNLMFTD